MALLLELVAGIPQAGYTPPPEGPREAKPGQDDKYDTSCQGEQLPDIKEIIRSTQIWAILAAK
jgi:hypothetical protein